MGILNRTPDSFYDQGANFAFDKFLEKASDHVDAGADLLDVGGVKAGPGEEVSEAEELDRVVGAIEAITARFDVPVSVDTWRASVAEASYQVGAVVGNDISGFGDPDYLRVAAEAGASVVATHIRLRPRVADPNPHYDDVVDSVREFLLERATQALEAGIPRERIIVDAGLDLGKMLHSHLISCEIRRSWLILGFRSCCLPRTRPVLASCWISRFTSAKRRHWPPQPLGFFEGAGSCEFMMLQEPWRSETPWIVC